jgi:hypothetical protein
MAFTLEELPSAPHLVSVFKPALSGVDFLNLRQVNFDYMAECIPGTNNATKLVRGYSLMAWVFWIYPRLLSRLGRDEANSEELIHFREKVESLFVWSHQLAGMGGVPGISSKIPEAQDGRVDLRFKAWNRSTANTSFIAAVQYGPSLLDLGGLGFLQWISDGIYVCTRAGAALGEALDERLRECPVYPRLTDLSSHEGTSDEAAALLPFWRIDETSPREAMAFGAVLYDPAAVEEKSPRGRRSSMISLILTALSSNQGPLESTEIRRRLALPGIAGLEPLTEEQAGQSRSWLILQLRQLERLAFEGLFSWLEGHLKRGGHQLPDAIVEIATQILADEWGFQGGATTDEVLLIAGPSINALSDFEFLVSTEEERFSPWNLCHRIREGVTKEKETALIIGMQSILLLNQCRPFLERDERLARHLEHGGSSRISFAHWFRLIDRFRPRPFRELIDWTLKNLIISQHLAVGTQRFDGLKIRLRMILEEDGLESLVTSPWKPDVTPDRLDSLLSLMQSCGLIQRTDEGFKVVN